MSQLANLLGFKITLKGISRNTKKEFLHSK